MSSLRLFAVAAVFGATLAASPATMLRAQEPGPLPAFQSGAMPSLPVRGVGGGEVFLEVTVAAGGRVAQVSPLRSTPSFTEPLADAVRQWTFDADEEQRILVAAVFRPPALYGPTLGERPRDVAPPSDRIPFPIATALPAASPLATAAGVVLLEVKVDRGGAVTGAVVRHSAPPFDDAARAAVRLWRFRPAVKDGRTVPAVVYVMMGFPILVTTPPANDRRP
jgi:TonB family protein